MGKKKLIIALKETLIFTSEDEPLPDEIESIKNNDADEETFSHDDIDWDK